MGGREEVCYGWVEVYWCDVFVEFETLVGISDGDCHSDGVV